MPPQSTSERAGRVARRARRWLKRNAAGVKRICYYYNHADEDPLACTDLIGRLPALETVELGLPEQLHPDDLGCLVKALAGCPRLKALDLSPVKDEDEEDEEGLQPYPAAGHAPAFAQLRSLTRLSLAFGEAGPTMSPAMLDAIVRLEGLVELELDSSKPITLPAALGRLKRLRELDLTGFNPCVLEAGSLNLPNLTGLSFNGCKFVGREAVLPGVTALHSLKHISFLGCWPGPRFFDHLLVQLPQLEKMNMSTTVPCRGGACAWLSRLPANMGSLSSTLLKLDFSGHCLADFPLALTQLTALECLDARENEFAVLPAGITALSRLTELRLGRCVLSNDPAQVHEKRPLDVRALGDLSGFPALRELTLALCEVTLCRSFLGAVRHASLASLRFSVAHPAPDSMAVVLQLGLELKKLDRGSVLQLANDGRFYLLVCHALRASGGRAPFEKFLKALNMYGAAWHAPRDLNAGGGYF